MLVKLFSMEEYYMTKLRGVTSCHLKQIGTTTLTGLFFDSEVPNLPPPPPKNRGKENW